jgi:hypothetical protein
MPKTNVKGLTQEDITKEDIVHAWFFSGLKDSSLALKWGT